MGSLEFVAVGSDCRVPAKALAAGSGEWFSRAVESCAYETRANGQVLVRLGHVVCCFRVPIVSAFEILVATAALQKRCKHASARCTVVNTVARGDENSG